MSAKSGGGSASLTGGGGSFCFFRCCALMPGFFLLVVGVKCEVQGLLSLGLGKNLSSLNFAMVMGKKGCVVRGWP